MFGFKKDENAIVMDEDRDYLQQMEEQQAAVFFMSLTDVILRQCKQM